MDERSFDKLARDLGTRSHSRRRALALAGVALGLVTGGSGLVENADAARRNQGKRRKSPRNQHGRGSGKNKGGGNTGHNGCQDGGSCPADPGTGRAGFLCADNRCSCGGLCCENGFACFVGANPADEVCCFDDAAATEIPEDVKFAVCPGAQDRDTCCSSNECDNGECLSFTPGRYRRNPR